MSANVLYMTHESLVKPIHVSVVGYYNGRRNEISTITEKQMAWLICEELISVIILGDLDILRVSSCHDKRGNDKRIGGRIWGKTK